MIRDNLPLMYYWRYLVLCDELDFNSNHLAVYLSNFSKTSGNLKPKRSQSWWSLFLAQFVSASPGRLNDHKPSQNYTTLDVRQTYHIGDDRARKSFNSIQLLKMFSKKIWEKRRNRDKSLSPCQQQEAPGWRPSSPRLQRHRTPTTNGNVGNWSLWFLWSLDPYPHFPCGGPAEKIGPLSKSLSFLFY